jgi:tRNA dimethylallyltransferase
MDIGTAKPSAAERAAVPHHLIDVIDPREAYSAAQFAADATRLIGEIHARGRLPLLVGGTMFRPGRARRCRRPAAVRAALDAEAARRLAGVAPSGRGRPAAAVRSHRTTRSASSVRWRSSSSPAGRCRPSHPRHRRADTTASLLSLEPTDRAWLHAHRPALRPELSEGFIAESSGCAKRGDLHTGLPSMRCVVSAGLGGAGRHARRRPACDVLAASRRPASWQAKRLTWLRGMARNRRPRMRRVRLITRATPWLARGFDLRQLAPPGPLLQ